jgi:L-ascorbate 6-phosphate lactonase
MIRDGQVGILWLGQSGFVLRFPTARVLIDAFLSPHRDRLVASPFSPREAKGFDVIACTHEHIDHLDLESLPALADSSPDARIVVPEPCVEMVVSDGIAAARVDGLQPGAPIEVSGITVHAIPACHGVHAADAYNFGGELSGGKIRYLGYVIQGGAVSVYHAGDTLLYDDLPRQLRQLAVDVALLPINGRDSAREAKDIVGNMSEAEAADLAVAARVKLAVPMHYDMFAANLGRPEKFVEAVRFRQGSPTVVIPARGEEFVYTKNVS